MCSGPSDHSQHGPSRRVPFPNARPRRTVSLSLSLLRVGGATTALRPESPGRARFPVQAPSLAQGTLPPAPRGRPHRPPGLSSWAVPTVSSLHSGYPTSPPSPHSPLPSGQQANELHSAPRTPRT